MRRRDARAQEVALLVKAILRDRQRIWRGRDARTRRDQRFSSFRRYVFEFSRDDMNMAREIRQRRVILIATDSRLRRDARRRAVRFICEDMNVEAQLRRSDREHAAELAPA